MTLSLVLCLAGMAGAGGEPGPGDPMNRSERIEAAFNGLSKDSMDLLPDFYDAAIVFDDPLGRIEGLENLRAYYEDMYDGVRAIHFAFSDAVVSGDDHVVFWTMTLEAKGLNRGRPVSVEGNSLIRFGGNDKVVYHRDTFDMGAMVYEQVPVLKWPVRWIKNRLSHSAD